MNPNEQQLERRIAATARAVLQDRLSLLEGARQLWALGNSLLGDAWPDPDFRLFGVIDSDTDDLPVGSGRANWSANALARKDADVAEAKAFYREDVRAACQRLVERYAPAADEC